MSELDRLKKLAGLPLNEAMSNLKPALVLKTLSKMMTFKTRDIDSILKKSGYNDNKLTDAKLDSFYFTSGGLNGLYKIEYDNQGDMNSGWVHITWDGKNFTADF